MGTLSSVLYKTTDKDIASDIYRKYRKANSVESPPFGDCQIIAALICLKIPEAEPVGGYCSCDEDSGTHWYCVLPDGEVLDPLGAEWIGGGIKEREEKVRGVCQLVYALYSSWEDQPEVLELGRELVKARDELHARFPTVPQPTVSFAEMFPDEKNLAPWQTFEHRLW